MKNSTLSAFCMLLGILSATAQSPWTLVSVATDNNYSSIYAIQPDKVMTSAEQGKLYQSNNGGQTMLPYQLEDNYSILNDIDFLNPQTGFAGGGCYFPTSECVDNIIASTTDGGQSWHWERIAIGLGVLLKLEVLDDGTLFALGDFNGVFRKLPNSSTWDSLGHPNHILPNGATNLQFFDTNHGYVENWTVVNGQYISHLFRTDDGGLHWTEVFTGNTPGFYSTHYFRDFQHGFHLGSTGQLGRTHDAGMNWTLEQVFDPTEALLKMDFVTPTVGYLTTWEQTSQRGRIYRSTDAGEHWELDLERDSTIFSDLHFADSKNGYALGNYRSVYKRTGTVSNTEPEADLGMHCAPNPAKDFVQVQFPANRSYNTLTVFDVWGRELQRLELVKGAREMEIDLSGFATGLYFLTPLEHPEAAKKLVVHH